MLRHGHSQSFAPIFCSQPHLSCATASTVQHIFTQAFMQKHPESSGSVTFAFPLLHLKFKSRSCSCTV